MEIKLKDYLKSGEIIAFVNFTASFQKSKSNRKISYVLDTPIRQNIKVKNYFAKNKSDLSEKRLEDACKMALLSPSILSRNMKDLSFTEIKKVRLVEGLLNNSESFVFVHFERGFYEKARKYYQKLFQKMIKYGKSILLITEDVSFLFPLVSRFVFFTEVGYEWVDDFYLEKIYQYVKKPPIISYITYLNQRGIDMEHYLEFNELLKGIYRSVSFRSRL